MDLNRTSEIAVETLSPRRCLLLAAELEAKIQELADLQRRAAERGFDGLSAIRLSEERPDADDDFDDDFDDDA
ncbi:MAG: hypothetical protein AAFR16_06475 [Pseudomonadota bacterium]